MDAPGKHAPQDRDSLWRLLRTRGLIPGPFESRELFLQRVEISGRRHATVDSRLLQDFDIAPDWIVVEPRSPQLHVWEGAATVIELNESGIWQPLVLLGSSLTLSQQALVAHEVIHAVRCCFHESLTEEVMAWQTCPVRWLKRCSLLCMDVKQMLLWFASFQSAIFGYLFTEPLWFLVAMLFSLLGLARAYQARRPLSKALSILKNQGHPGWPLLIHLTAEEIAALCSAPENFWASFERESHFRFEFMRANFATLRTK